MRKFFISFLILIAAIEIELALASSGFFVSITLGVLIAFACTLSLRETIFLGLCAAILFRMISITDPIVLTLVLFPLAISLLRKKVQWEPWAMVPAAAVVGAMAVILASGIHISTIGYVAFIEDVIITATGGVFSYAIVSKV